MPKAVLLDLDDTILDDSSSVERSWRDACNAHHSEYDSFNPEEVYTAVRQAGEWFWSDSERHRVGRLDLDAARVQVVRLALEQIGVEGRRRDDVAEKILGASLGKPFIETNDDCLFDAKDAKSFNLLIESLQERRRRFGM